MTNKFYGLFDAEGKSQAFYADDIYPPDEDGSRHAAIPTDAVELTEAEWQELVEDQAHTRYVKSAVTRIELPPPPPQPLSKTELLLQDAMARIEALEKR